MDTQTPKYFYLVQFFTNHDLIIQKIIEAAKVFTDTDPDASIYTTPINNGYTILVIESSQPISEAVMSKFESITDCVEGLVHLFSHTTINLSKNGIDKHVPSYVFSAYHHLHFSFFSRYFGEGLLFVLSTKKKLKAITGGVYVTKAFKNELLVVLESDTPFIKAEIDDFLLCLNHPKVKVQSSFRNF